ncbi:MAG: type VI secretion system ATPase TssH, partial [Pseudomonadota bacterium]
AKIDLDDLGTRYAEICAGSGEDKEAVPLQPSGAPAQPTGSTGEGALETYATDLTARAEEGKIDPIVGRDAEIRQMVDILMRRRQNNPILVGEAGVGKTAVVEGFALRLSQGDVPPMLKDVRLLSLDIGLLQAGASMKGEFENRLRSVIEGVQSSETPIILFIDEAHTLIGAGGAAGTGDAANLLKPALARGELRTVAATTWAEYKKHIEKDPALNRRFEAVKIEEPSEEKALLMMRGVASTLESHHQIQILDEALEAAVRLSNRYIPSRQLPDKSVALLDTACARISVSQHAVPAEVEDCRRRIEALEVEAGIIARELAMGLDAGDRQTSVAAALEAERAALADVEARWEAEKAQVTDILSLRAQLRGDGMAVDPTGSALESAADADASAPLDDASRAALAAELRAKTDALATLQGTAPLVLASADAQAVASVVGDWTGIPVSQMSADEIDTVLNLPQILSARVVGQDHAMEMIAKRIETSRAGLTAPEKPVGVFLLAGPSGVGKTETAIALAEALYGGEQNMITINMSEFQEAHTVSTLKGAPPGYVGYGEGGVLTEAVRRRPYSVVLLDEVEKAHSDVHEIFFQVFDKGRMEDGEGRSIDFKNTLILLTSNTGTDLIMKMCADPDFMPDSEGLAKALREPLLKVFPPALLGRLSVIPYFPLSDETLRLVTTLKLGSIVKRIRAAHGAELTYGDDVLDQICARCTEIESGGRMIDAILNNTLLPTVSREILTRMRDGAPPREIRISVQDGEFSYQMA